MRVEFSVLPSKLEHRTDRPFLYLVREAVDAGTKITGEWRVMYSPMLLK